MEMEDGQDLDTDGLLITMIQTFPILWDNSLKEYRDETKKINAWQSIAEAMEKQVAIIQADWRRLRNRFTRKIRESDLPSGSGAAKGDSWSHLPAMMFLKGVVRSRKTSGKPQKRPASASSSRSSSSVTASTSRDTFHVEEADVDDPSPRDGEEGTVEIVSPNSEAGPAKRLCRTSTPVASRRNMPQPFGEFEGCLMASLNNFKTMAPPVPQKKICQRDAVDVN